MLYGEGILSTFSLSASKPLDLQGPFTPLDPPAVPLHPPSGGTDGQISTSSLPTFTPSRLPPAQANHNRSPRNHQTRPPTTTPGRLTATHHRAYSYQNHAPILAKISPCHQRPPSQLHLNPPPMPNLTQTTTAH